MSSPDWKDLERLWQSSPAESADVIIARQDRRRWLSRLNTLVEMALTILGVGVSVWAMTLDKPYALLSGAGALVFTVFAAVASLWARLPRRSAPDESVTAAIDAAIHRARASVRRGLASFWIVAAALVLLAVMALAWAAAAAYPAEGGRRLLIVLGVMTAWTAGCQVFSIVYYLRRAGELTRLEEIKRSLAAD
jgi:ferric-dicitrate binding protein FerR (iron transport regulator)